MLRLFGHTIRDDDLLVICVVIILQKGLLRLKSWSSYSESVAIGTMIWTVVVEVLVVQLAHRVESVTLFGAFELIWEDSHFLTNSGLLR